MSNTGTCNNCNHECHHEEQCDEAIGIGMTDKWTYCGRDSCDCGLDSYNLRPPDLSYD